MALTGKAQVIADRTQGLVGILQEFSPLFQLTTEDEGREGEAELFLKIGRKVSAAKVYIIGYITGCNMLVGILLYETDSFLNAVVGRCGGLCFIDFWGKGMLIQSCN